MITVFRIDDVTPYMDREPFERALGILTGAGAFPLLGVVPDLMDETLSLDIPKDSAGRFRKLKEFSPYVNDLSGRGCVLSMHGFRHLYTTRACGVFPLNDFSEFAGVDPEEQMRRISTGKKLLTDAGIDTNLFMAPGHTFDANTLKALRENGFTGVTDGFGREPYMRQGLVFYPIAFNTERDVRSKAPGFTTVVLHPGTMSERGFGRLSRMVSDPEVHTAPYSRFLEETPVKQGIPGLISGYLKADFKRRYVRLRGNGGDPGKHIGETYVYD